MDSPSHLRNNPILTQLAAARLLGFGRCKSLLRYGLAWRQIYATSFPSVPEHLPLLVCQIALKKVRQIILKMTLKTCPSRAARFRPVGASQGHPLPAVFLSVQFFSSLTRLPPPCKVLFLQSRLCIEFYADHSATQGGGDDGPEAGGIRSHRS